MRKSTIPNAFTFMNLSLGILSIISLQNNHYRSSALFILLAALVDRYDGRIARYLDVSSPLGKELDSLADLVSFGVAPSLLTFTLYNFNVLGPGGLMGYGLLLLFPICGAYRLARYNATSFDGIFTGVPITVAGSFIALFVFINSFRQNAFIIKGLPIAFLLLLSYLMISNYKFKKV